MKRPKVFVDASYRDGHAGLAVTGALGDHVQCVESEGSAQSEVMALEWAIELALIQGRTHLTFITDCQSVIQHTSHLVGMFKDFDWLLQWKPRGQNSHANIQARRAWRALRFSMC